ncbi:MAG: class I SAM-dependent methyltransferase [Myxococcota bacterium]
MRTPESYGYDRYLRSKRTVDDRALNPGVLDAILSSLPTDRALRIVELGGGIGTMVDRLVESGRIARADYLLVDAEASFLEEAETLAPKWRVGETRHGSSAGVSFEVSTRHARLEPWLDEDGARFDLIIAHAVLDLVDTRSVLPQVLGRLADGGLFWPTINFDGDTIFVPPDPRDAALLEAYHRSMDERTIDGRPAGSSTAGRELFTHIVEAGGSIVRAGSSDWVVFAGETGYAGDEAYFLHHIVHTVEEELKSHPELGAMVQAWGRERHAQVESGALVYIAHQLDFAVRRGYGVR